MMPTNVTIFLCVFDDARSAASAFEALERAGFDRTRIGLVAPHTEASDGAGTEHTGAGTEHPGAGTEHTRARTEHPGAWAGAVTGGIAGGILATAVSFAIPGVGPMLAAGVFATFLGGTAAGAAAGGLMGALSDLDVPDEHVRQSERELHAGKTLVSVRSAGRVREVEEILRRYGGRIVTDSPTAAAPATTGKAGGLGADAPAPTTLE